MKLPILLAAILSTFAIAATSARSDQRVVYREKASVGCVGACVPESDYLAIKRLAAKRLRGWNRANRRIVGLKLTLKHSPSVTEAIELSCTVYGHCSELWRKARCETGGTFSPRSKNRHSTASGLFQFLTSTWAGTPFGRFSIWSPYANALAAGWMHAHGRGGEWVCQ